MALNPNAPLFVPAAFRQVEDFSPEWWELVTTSPWYHNYWLSQHQGEDGFYADDDGDGGVDDIANLLPETFDFDVGDEFDNMEAQFEEFIKMSELEGDRKESPQFNRKNDYGFSAEALVQNMKYFEEISPKFQGERAKYVDKVVKNSSAKYSPRRIQQPR